MSAPALIHAVPATGSPPRDHSASSTCWCKPRQAFTDLSTGGAIVVHVNAPASTAEPELPSAYRAPDAAHPPCPDAETYWRHQLDVYQTATGWRCRACESGR